MQAIRQLAQTAGLILAFVLTVMVIAGPPDRRELEPAVVEAAQRLRALVDSPATTPEDIVSTYFWALNNHRPDVGQACWTTGHPTASASDYSYISTVSVISIGGRQPTISSEDYRDRWREVTVLWVEYRVKYEGIYGEDDGTHGKNYILVRERDGGPWRILDLGY